MHFTIKVHVSILDLWGGEKMHVCVCKIKIDTHRNMLIMLRLWHQEVGLRGREAIVVDWRGQSRKQL